MISIFSRLLAQGKQAIYACLKIFLTLFALETITAEIARSQERRPIHISSQAFTPAGHIPERYTCRGLDESPQLSWTNVPNDARSLVLIVDDPDAPSGSFTHWIIYNLPTTVANLPAGLTPFENLTQGGRQGLNDFNRVGYNGPCPPPGGLHHYHFRIFALDQLLQFNADPNAERVRAAIQGHVLAEGETIGVFNR
jgi:Raf kinase inhibitor-like YbhB/YbcL family protein